MKNSSNSRPQEKATYYRRRTAAAAGVLLAAGAVIHIPVATPASHGVEKVSVRLGSAAMNLGKHDPKYSDEELAQFKPRTIKVKPGWGAWDIVEAVDPGAINDSEAFTQLEDIATEQGILKRKYNGGVEHQFEPGQPVTLPVIQEFQSPDQTKH